MHEPLMYLLTRRASAEQYSTVALANTLICNGKRIHLIINSTTATVEAGRRDSADR